MKKYKLKFIKSERFVYFYEVVETISDEEGIEASSKEEAARIYKDNYPDFVILPVENEDIINSLKNIEVYYSFYNKTNKQKLKNKIRDILLKYKVIDDKNRLFLNLEPNKEDYPERILSIEKSIKKEYELYNIFLELNHIS